VTKSSGAYELSDVVETALAKALVLAAAKRWDVVLQISEELGRRGSEYSAVSSVRPRRSMSI
jgi:hypothetical protein